MVIYTDKLIPKQHAGYTIGPVILIRPAYREDRGLLEHEKVHVRQFLQGRWFSGAGTLKGEVEAYKEQANWYPDYRIPLFASYLVTRYGFNLTQAEAEGLLRGGK